MATPVIMPRQGQSVESCIIAKWNKQVGDKVAVGDLLFTYETDKATFDEEAKIGGTMLAIFFKEGDDVPCLTNVCVIGNVGEDFNVYNPNSNTQEVVPKNEQTSAKQVNKNETAPVILAETQDLSGHVKISPRAKNLADKQGADLRYANATGPNGRIIERDIRTLIENGVLVTPAAKDDYYAGDGKIEGTGLGGRVTTSDVVSSTDVANSSNVASSTVFVNNGADFEEVKHTNIRKVIAKTMHYSLSTMAQITLNSSFDATEILSFREKLKVYKESIGSEKITINDIILFAVAKTLLFHKDCNAHYYDEKMVFFKNVNLGVAIDTQRGLMVPTLFNANLKSLNQISKEVKMMVEECQKGTISPDALKGGTFTITNLGTLGIESFTPVINPPQTCILGVNTIETKVKEVNGQPICYKSMSLSLTFDHRALDGAPAAKFLKDLIKNLENFSVLLLLMK
jgi:pyruvate dehydrogenase E2 component (dihydrolipoamide acetyltransferase)